MLPSVSCVFIHKATPFKNSTILNACIHVICKNKIKITAIPSTILCSNRLRKLIADFKKILRKFM